MGCNRFPGSDGDSHAAHHRRGIRGHGAGGEAGRARGREGENLQLRVHLSPGIGPRLRQSNAQKRSNNEQRKKKAAQATGSRAETCGPRRRFIVGCRRQRGHGQFPPQGNHSLARLRAQAQRAPTCLGRDGPLTVHNTAACRCSSCDSNNTRPRHATLSISNLVCRRSLVAFCGSRRGRLRERQGGGRSWVTGRVGPTHLRGPRSLGDSGSFSGDLATIRSSGATSSVSSWGRR